MGMLLSFVPRTPAPSRPLDLAGIEASIIIFPGVRYERPGNPPSVNQKPLTGSHAGSSDRPPAPRH